MENLEKYRFTKDKIACITGGITFCGYLEVMQHLSHTNVDQAAVLSQQFNQGAIQFTDWDYNTNDIPEC
ncbi:MAG: hypothetical protein R6V16_00110 [Bacteroidales bacterium]